MASSEGLTQAEFMLLDQRGDALLQQGRAAEAEQLFRGLLAKLEAGAAYDATYDQAVTCLRLGRCRAAQGQPTQAIEWQRRALAGFEGLSGADESAKRMVGKVYTDLADNLAASGKFQEAQQAYENGLEISREVGDHRSVGVKLGQLGTLALQRNDLAEASKRYSEALDTFRALGEPQTEAVAWHQLGVVAQEAKDWDEAERCYRESLKLKETIKDMAGVARTCNQLAIVAKGAGRPDEAERWYLRAIDGLEQTGQEHNAAKPANNIAGERDPNALLPGLDVTQSIVVAEILRTLLTPGAAAQSDGGNEGITLEQLIGMVGTAASPDAPAGLAEQLHAVTRQLATDPNAPVEIQALGRALNAILAGERNPDLSGLSSAVTAKVRAMVAGL